ncbi:predicted protein [Chaetomium globosum CBS 148.51]|uniref:Uncharacterized protein n=1 Tax=Chaetomium globosum (strain ATCC 6205 / CBS 148.51 / DSM 1962 / NBRC 6347 / NRRL 1970) TaxID=306901 RepID=Q2HEM3_CHAGB|nr:uncharacterized protein CHGG_01331 [Chaetomium globosum CBS 148.51]EAQ93096.1 predicted protein [Chaetomium globosum CBS 148.51]
MIILSAVLFLIIAALIVVSSILGTKIAKLENTISPLAVAVAESAANGTTTNNNNNNNNNNNPYTTTTSSPVNNLNPSQTSSTTTSSTAPPPAPLPPTIQVAGWTYLGCFYDSERGGQAAAALWHAGGGAVLLRDGDAGGAGEPARARLDVHAPVCGPVGDVGELWRELGAEFVERDED